jgi:hypothetical protein
MLFLKTGPRFFGLRQPTCGICIDICGERQRTQLKGCPHVGRTEKQQKRPAIMPTLRCIHGGGGEDCSCCERSWTDWLRVLAVRTRHQRACASAKIARSAISTSYLLLEECNCYSKVRIVLVAACRSGGVMPPTTGEGRQGPRSVNPRSWGHTASPTARGGKNMRSHALAVTPIAGMAIPYGQLRQSALAQRRVTVGGRARRVGRSR